MVTGGLDSRSVVNVCPVVDVDPVSALFSAIWSHVCALILHHKVTLQDISIDPSSCPVLRRPVLFGDPEASKSIQCHPTVDGRSLTRNVYNTLYHDRLKAVQERSLE